MINPAARKQLTLVVWGMNVLGVLCVGTLAFGSYQASGWLIRERDSVDARRLNDLSLLARKEQVRADREAADQRVKSLATKLAELRSHIPASPKEAEFLAQISSLAEQTGVRVKNFRPGQVASAGAVSTFDVQLSLVGSYASICKLISGLADVPRVLSVSRLTLNGPQSAGDGCVAELTVSLCFAATTAK